MCHLHAWTQVKKPKEQGRGYQTRINDVLKAYVLSQRLKEQREALADEPEE